MDWSYAQRELLQKTGYDITKELEEKEKKFEEKEQEFKMRSDIIILQHVSLYMCVMVTI